MLKIEELPHENEVTWGYLISHPGVYKCTSWSLEQTVYLFNNSTSDIALFFSDGHIGTINVNKDSNWPNHRFEKLEKIILELS